MQMFLLFLHFFLKKKVPHVLCNSSHSLPEKGPQKKEVVEEKVHKRYGSSTGRGSGAG